MRKLNISIVIGALVALLGAALVFSYGRSVDRRIAEGRETVGVLVASQPLAAGTLAGSLGSGVQIRQVPSAFVPDEALRDLGDVAGLELLAPVPQGGYLTRPQFGSSQGADVVRPTAGKVALAVGVGVTPGVARYVRGGDVVDLFVTYEGDGSGVADRRTKLFLSGVRVLSVQVAPPPAAEDEEAASSQPADPATQVVAVMDLLPEEAERVVNATTLGSLYLALSAEGQEHSTDEGVTPDTVVTDAA